VGGLRPREEATLGLLRPADPVRRPLRRPDRAALDRKAKALTILGIWFEPDFAPMEASGFVGALRDALEAYRSFVGATKVTWPRTRPGRDVAGA
jgi:uncharacterized protein YcaQ